MSQPAGASDIFPMCVNKTPAGLISQQKSFFAAVNSSALTETERGLMQAPLLAV